MKPARVISRRCVRRCSRSSFFINVRIMDWLQSGSKFGVSGPGGGSRAGASPQFSTGALSVSRRKTSSRDGRTISKRWTGSPCCRIDLSSSAWAALASFTRSRAVWLASETFSTPGRLFASSTQPFQVALRLELDQRHAVALQQRFSFGIDHQAPVVDDPDYVAYPLDVRQDVRGE